jgi:hypothetical protein
VSAPDSTEADSSIAAGAVDFGPRQCGMIIENSFHGRQ